MATRDSSSEIRRAQIVSYSLTELMLLLVFMAVAFSFLARKEDLRDVQRTQVELIEARAKIANLERRNQDLAAQLRTALAELNDYKKLWEATRSGNWQASAPPKIKIGGVWYNRDEGKAPGNPQCVLTSSFLLTLYLQRDGTIRGEPAWGDRDEISGLSGLDELASGRGLVVTRFSQVARGLRQSALAQRKCVFAVKAVRQTNDADLFDQQLRAVEEAFYVRRYKK